MNLPPLPTVLSASCILLLIHTGNAQEAEPQVTLNVGDAAPSFTLKDDQGQDWNSDEHYGEKVVVLYFYPADMTPGCTKQACGYRDHMDQLERSGVEVVGISGDSVRNHQLFKKVHNLNFALLADVNGEAARKFGVPYFAGQAVVKREIDGTLESLVREITPHRWTFVVGKDQTIKLKNDRVKPAEDSERILKLLDELQG